MAYAGLRRSELARATGISASNLDRMTAGRRAASWAELWAIADACGVPREWFTVEIARFFEIVPEGMPRFSNSATRRLAEIQQQLSQADQRRRERPGTPAEAAQDQDDRGRAR